MVICAWQRQTPAPSPHITVSTTFRAVRAACGRASLARPAGSRSLQREAAGRRKQRCRPPGPALPETRQHHSGTTSRQQPEGYVSREWRHRMRACGLTSQSWPWYVSIGGIVSGGMSATSASSTAAEHQHSIFLRVRRLLLSRHPSMNSSLLAKPGSTDAGEAWPRHLCNEECTHYRIVALSSTGTSTAGAQVEIAPKRCACGSTTRTAQPPFPG